MSSRWSLLAGVFVLGACAQEVEDLPVPRAWSYGTAEVAVVESPAGATVPARQLPASVEAPPAPPGGIVRAVSALERTLTALVTPSDRRVTAEISTARRR